MKKDIYTRLRRLERKHRLSGGVDAITEALRLRSEEQIISLLMGSKLFPTGIELKEARRMVQEIKRDVR